MQLPYHNWRPGNDACGTGFIANSSGKQSHSVLQRALQAVTNLTHRGGASSDGQSGDGAGVLVQLPHTFFRKVLSENRLPVPASDDFGVGMFFLPRADSPAGKRLQSKCRKISESVFQRMSLQVVCWRKVPVDISCLGAKSAQERPAIYQVFLNRPAVVPSGLAFEQRLYLARKEIERKIRSQGVSPFYIPSLSHRTIAYKGLFIAPQLRQFYLDLQDARFETALAVFHQRFSTNTFPNWYLAQPFRQLAHNGEINTLQGNENWLQAWERELESPTWGGNLKKLTPILSAGGSDSSKLDNILELLTLSGRSILHSVKMLLPEAYEEVPGLDDDLRAFYEYHETMMEPWDGPATVVFTDGGVVGAALDRNGLRPARYTITKDGFTVLASESGVIDIPAENVLQKGRLGPGGVLAVDTQAGTVLYDDEIKKGLSAERPYREWLSRNRIAPPPDLPQVVPAETKEDRSLSRRQIAFGYSKEDVERILIPMSVNSVIPVGSMGDDTPLAIFSEQPRPLYSYFKQKFAQVTNPPIDPIRERLVMSLSVMVGHRGNILEESETHSRFIKFDGPVLSIAEFDWLKQQDPAFYKYAELSACFNLSDGPDGLQVALQRLLQQSVDAVDSGAALLFLSDRAANEEVVAIPMLLAVSAVHHHLIRTGRRMRVSLICECGDLRDEHHLACLLGYGATAVLPYLAYDTIADLVRRRKVNGVAVDEALSNYRNSLAAGLLKIMAKMGISALRSYHGAQIFEILGLDRDMVDQYFSGTESRLGGFGMAALAGDQIGLHAVAYPEGHGLPDYGLFRFRKKGEPHAYNPEMLRSLHHAVRNGDADSYQVFSKVVNERDALKLRDMFDFESGRPALDPDEVELAHEIVKRFCTTAMSLGALSREAHIALAIGMNRLGATSNSGEGGEDPARFQSTVKPGLLSNQGFELQPGDCANSRIKQVASGRFGVTPAYLRSAAEIEIKMAQGAKPGEGGQLPGHKVSEEIAKIRHTTPGTTLISPPPHHDIYSIEDLAQLIYDLKTVNPQASIGVKLVAEAGVGAVAAGVAKACADVIHISGHDGGTGASPLSSIKNTGISWELGLSEAQHVLRMNGLRDRVLLRVDGGLKTGRDVVLAALLGADQFGFGTMALVAVGCVMARQCHLNTCPVGIATQRQDLRLRFTGKPEQIQRYMLFVAEEVRTILASLGVRSLAELVGRSDFIKEKVGSQPADFTSLALGAMLEQATPEGTGTPAVAGKTDWQVKHLDDTLLQSLLPDLEQGRAARVAAEIRNVDRAVGARLAGEVEKRARDSDCSLPLVQIDFTGSAGQSFAAFCTDGLYLNLQGDANDYVCKGMTGGEVSIYPPEQLRERAHENVIIGNTVMYGATGGSLYVAGQAGERFCVRNSGGVAVVEGVGDHACEYMTGGAVVVLGAVGKNFAAGMTGGNVYVLDQCGDVGRCLNAASVELAEVGQSGDGEWLSGLLQTHLEKTGSALAERLLKNWEISLQLFCKVVPKAGPVSATQGSYAGKAALG